MAKIYEITGRTYRKYKKDAVNKLKTKGIKSEEIVAIKFLKSRGLPKFKAVYVKLGKVI